MPAVNKMGIADDDSLSFARRPFYDSTIPISNTRHLPCQKMNALLLEMCVVKEGLTERPNNDIGKAVAGEMWPNNKVERNNRKHDKPGINS